MDRTRTYCLRDVITVLCGVSSCALWNSGDLWRYHGARVFISAVVRHDSIYDDLPLRGSGVASYNVSEIEGMSVTTAAAANRRKIQHANRTIKWSALFDCVLYFIVRLFVCGLRNARKNLSRF